MLFLIQAFFKLIMIQFRLIEHLLSFFDLNFELILLLIRGTKELTYKSILLNIENHLSKRK